MNSPDTSEFIGCLTELQLWWTAGQQVTVHGAGGASPSRVLAELTTRQGPPGAQPSDPTPPEGEAFTPALPPLGHQ